MPRGLHQQHEQIKNLLLNRAWHVCNRFHIMVAVVGKSERKYLLSSSPRGVVTHAQKDKYEGTAFSVQTVVFVYNRSIAVRCGFDLVSRPALYCDGQAPEGVVFSRLFPAQTY